MENIINIFLHSTTELYLDLDLYEILCISHFTLNSMYAYLNSDVLLYSVCYHNCSYKKK